MTFLFYFQPHVQSQSYSRRDASGQFMQQAPGQAAQQGGYNSMQQQYQAQQYGGGVVPQSVSSSTGRLIYRSIY